MTKKSREKPSAPTRKQLSRRARDERLRKQLYIAATIFVVAIVLVLAIGLYTELVVKPGRPVARVAGVPIRTDEYEKRLAYRRFSLESSLSQIQTQIAMLGSSSGNEFLVQYYQQQLQYLNSELDNAPQQVLEEMIDDELIRQEAQRLGLTVSDAEVQSEVERQFGFDRNPPTPTPTPITATLPITVTPTPTTAPMTEAEFLKSFADYVATVQKSANFGEQDLRKLFRDSLLAQKLQEYLGNQLPTTALQVRARHILLETPEDAEAALARLKAGEDFAKLAEELSTDESTKANGGDLGWFPMGQMDADFEKVAFNTPVGEISDICQTAYGYHIIKVEERDENRPLDTYVLEQMKGEALSKWLEEQRATAVIERYLKFESPAPTIG